MLNTWNPCSVHTDSLFSGSVLDRSKYIPKTVPWQFGRWFPPESVPKGSTDETSSCYLPSPSPLCLSPPGIPLSRIPGLTGFCSVELAPKRLQPRGHMLFHIHWTNTTNYECSPQAKGSPPQAQRWVPMKQWPRGHSQPAGKSVGCGQHGQELDGAPWPSGARAAPRSSPSSSVDSASSWQHSSQTHFSSQAHGWGATPF